MRQQHIHKHFSINILVVMTSSGESSSRRNARTADAEPKHFDNNDPRYSWLLDGRLAEACRVPSDRLYKYRIKTKVLCAWEKNGCDLHSSLINIQVK
ncbi:hypothetical protein Gotur_034028 [Gossypium turneri]